MTPDIGRGASGSRSGAFLGLVLVVALAGCGALVATLTSGDDPTSQVVVNPTPTDGDTATPASTTVPIAPPTTGGLEVPQTTASTEVTPSTSPTEPDGPDTGAPDALDRYVVAENESLYPAKVLAIEVIEALTNYDAADATVEIVSRVTDEPEFGAVIALRAAPLLRDDVWSRGKVQYAQLGGHRNDRASVMVVVEQSLGSGPETLETVVRTVDVRVDLTDAGWQLVDIDDPGGSPVERPDDLAPEAVAVLDDPRIVLPDSAKWDIYAGHTSPTLLALMTELADITPFGVVTLSNGHPFHVFETQSVSNHTVGRAVDVHLLGDDLVIDNGFDGSRVHEIVQWLYDHPSVSQVGSPWNLDGAGRRSFTDDVHLDHLHIGVGS